MAPSPRGSALAVYDSTIRPELAITVATKLSINNALTGTTRLKDLATQYGESFDIVIGVKVWKPG
jgi:hypothetical protein